MSLQRRCAHQQAARYTRSMPRALAALLLAVLIVGPVAASVCDVRCLAQSHHHVVLAPEASELESTAASEHQHHHAPVADAQAVPEAADSSWTEAGSSAVLTIGDCCVDCSQSPPVQAWSAQPPSASVAHPGTMSGACDARPRRSTSRRVAHALEPPVDVVARHPSSILRI